MSSNTSSKNQLIIILGVLVVLIIYNIYADYRLQSNIGKLTNAALVKYSEINDHILATQPVDIDDINSLLSIKSKDSTIIELQKLVAYYQDRLSPGVVTEIQTQTVFDTIVQVVEVNDSITTFSYKDDWVSFDGKLFESNLDFNLKSKDKIHLIQLDDNTVEVYNENPYSITNGLYTFNINKNKNKSKITWGLNLGIGVQYNLLKNQIGLGPQLGIGINYKF